MRGEEGGRCTNKNADVLLTLYRLFELKGESGERSESCDPLSGVSIQVLTVGFLEKWWKLQLRKPLKQTMIEQKARK